jgi:hypothetical protein
MGKDKETEELIMISVTYINPAEKKKNLSFKV